METETMYAREHKKRRAFLLPLLGVKTDKDMIQAANKAFKKTSLKPLTKKDIENFRWCVNNGCYPDFKEVQKPFPELIPNSAGKITRKYPEPEEVPA